MNLLDYIKNGYTYSEYIAEVEDQLENEIENDDPKEYVKYYALGLQRMNRIYKTFKFTPTQEQRLKETNNNFQLLTITEGWCGDGSQIIPVVEKIAEVLNIESKYIFRDQHLDLMENYKTNGALSIPIIIGVSENGEELFRFGPRPAYGMDLLAKFKKDPDIYTNEEFHDDIQKYYNTNKGEDIFNELLILIEDNLSNK